MKKPLILFIINMFYFLIVAQHDEDLVSEAHQEGDVYGAPQHPGGQALPGAAEDVGRGVDLAYCTCMLRCD